ncbi:MAG: hypothetical protein ACYDH6_20245 [Acidimicrobiales bacterium]
MRQLRPAIAAAAMLLATACGGGLQFAKDARVRVVSPRQLATVSAPVHLRWTTDMAAGRPVTYAVFVDALPVHPGQNLRSLAGARCAGVVGCVDVAFLNRHAVYLTTEPSLDLDALPVLATARGERDMHTVTIVVVDPDWRRLGEASWSVTFALRHQAAA